MLKHIVMWKFLDFADGRSKQENAILFKQKLESLVGVVEELKFMEVGINDGYDTMSYDIVLTSHFESLEALERYKNHPEHVKVSQFCVKVRESRVVIDYH